MPLGDVGAGTAPYGTHSEREVTDHAALALEHSGGVATDDLPANFSFYLSSLKEVCPKERHSCVDGVFAGPGMRTAFCDSQGG